jgi:hypothetical protein
MNQDLMKEIDTLFTDSFGKMAILVVLLTLPMCVIQFHNYFIFFVVRRDKNNEENILAY